jgi:hypothetical protein
MALVRDSGRDSKRDSHVTFVAANATQNRLSAASRPLSDDHGQGRQTDRSAVWEPPAKGTGRDLWDVALAGPDLAWATVISRAPKRNITSRIDLF